MGQTLYGDDLAYIHDVAFGTFATDATPGLLALLEKRRILDGLIVDLGCGSGHLAKELVAAGYTVYGIDASPSMVALAKRRVPRARFDVAPFREARLPKCAAVTSIGECLSYRATGAAHLTGLRVVFERVHEALQPGGIFVFDVLAPGSLGPAGCRRTFSEGEDWTVLVDAREDREAGTLTRRITTFRRVGGAFRRNREQHVLQLTDAPRLARELRRLGFRVSTVHGYGALRFRPAHVGFIARKPRQGERRHSRPRP